MEHFSHKHPLELIDEVQSDDILCNGCNKQIISGSAAYTCRDCCNYNLHKKCGELPKQIKHPMHLQHPLTLYSHPPYGIGSSCWCNLCKAEWKWFTYHCSSCKFDVDILCELEDKVIEHEAIRVRQMEHFSHEHPLELIDEVQRDDDGDVILCNGCNKHIISGSAAYTCRECSNYNLHKRCAELPKQIQHPMHLQHPLTLFSHPLYSSTICSCNVCKATGWKWFTYNCSICEFDVDILCVLEEDKVIQHEGHHHPLTFVERSASFNCDACSTEEKDTSYRCTTCSFWIHKSCAKLPTTIKLSFDDHPFELAFSLPIVYRNFRPKCKICRKKVDPSMWVYYCALCKYFAHLKCATVDKEPFEAEEFQRLWK